jgi:hypothetical protein
MTLPRLVVTPTSGRLKKSTRLWMGWRLMVSLRR